MTRTIRMFLVPLTIIVAACNEGSPLTGPELFGFAAITIPESQGAITVCKVGASGSYTFDVVYVSGAVPNTPAGDPFNVTAGSCVVGVNNGSATTVTIQETGPVPVDVDSVQVWQDPVPLSLPLAYSHTVFNNNPIQLTFGDQGWILVYFNHVEGGEGCTPGFWKQDHHFSSWPNPPYAPSDLFSSVFEDAFPGLTLLEVVGLNGGGLNALGRHTVAALLNAESGNVSYGMTAQEVIDAFNAVFPGTKDDYNALKGTFEGLNEQGCPLPVPTDVPGDD